MYVKRRKNRSGSTSVQVLKKVSGKTLLVKTIGSSSDLERIAELVQAGNDFVSACERQLDFGLFKSTSDKIVGDYLRLGSSPKVVAKGPEIILGKIFDDIGFNAIKEDLFRYLVLARLTYPVSKLKTTEYLLSHQQQEVDVSTVYRFLDRFHKQHKSQVEEISFRHSQSVLGGQVAVVFYDMTTLYFEAEDEDDLRKIGFSKDGKFQNPQIMLGLLVGKEGYPIAYDIFEGNTFEGKTLLQVVEQAQSKYGFSKPTIVADSALLSKANIDKLVSQDYKFIIGARIKNETAAVKRQILDATNSIDDQKTVVIDKPDNLRLIVSYSKKRAKKDAHNRQKGLARLEKLLHSGKLTKQQVNNRGYNKFLILDGEITVSIDQSKVEHDQVWDGLKGYVTNSNLTPDQAIAQYQQLWKIEKAFRISKTDLRIRPIFHRKKDRIEAHICIAFVAYAVYKELERQLKTQKIQISVQKAIELTKTIFQIEFRLPDSRQQIQIFNQLLPEQQLLLKLSRFGGTG